jgi:hypothetical protein
MGGSVTWVHIWHFWFFFQNAMNEYNCRIESHRPMETVVLGVYSHDLETERNSWCDEMFCDIKQIFKRKIMAKAKRGSYHYLMK